MKKEEKKAGGKRIGAGRPTSHRHTKEYGKIQIEFMPREKWNEIRIEAKRIRENWENEQKNK
jgi:hypothetical protein